MPTEPASRGTRGAYFDMIRILLAEDDDVMREYLARALTSAGLARALDVAHIGRNLLLTLTNWLSFFSTPSGTVTIPY